MPRWVLKDVGMRDQNVRSLLKLDKAAKCGPTLAKLAKVLQEKKAYKQIAGEVCAHRNLQVHS